MRSADMTDLLTACRLITEAPSSVALLVIHNLHASFLHMYRLYAEIFVLSLLVYS